MISTVICPQCQRPTRLVGMTDDGRVQCTNTGCGHTFVPPVAPTSSGSSAPEKPPAAAPVRPKLLDELPPPLATSPGFIAGAIGFVLLYGVAMAAVLPGIKKATHASPSRPARPKMVATAPDLPPRPSPAPVATPETKPEVKVAAAEEHRDSPKSPPEAKPKTKKAQPKADTALAAVTKPRTVETKPETVAAPPEPRVRGFESLGTLIDPDGDCQLTRAGGGVELYVPARLHSLSVHYNIMNAPRALVGDVSGDFSAEVFIATKFNPGTRAVGNLPMAFQSAGLLLWEETSHYLRLERSTSLAPGRQPEFEVFLDYYQGAKLVDHQTAKVPDQPVYLRLERRGRRLLCQYSLDGSAWQELASFESRFNPAVGVGLSASNTAQRPLRVRFEQFAVTEAPASP